MSKFLLVDLNETKTKKLAETITSTTSRKILNHLAEKEQDTENNISNELNLPISTVHYHLQKLLEAKLVEAKEFHYSEKGREVNHYQLANKYIIIAPKKVSGLREKLKGILPAVLITIGISVIIKTIQSRSLTIIRDEVSSTFMEEANDAVADIALKSAKLIYQTTPTAVQPDIALWFLIGGLAAIVVHLTYQIIKEKRKSEE